MRDVIRGIIRFWAVFTLVQVAAAETEYAELEQNVRQFAEQKQMPTLSMQIVGENGPIWSM
ncbi:MAG: hypothetical protein RIC89_19560, partial [Pseudomonadales bacterium]